MAITSGLRRQHDVAGGASRYMPVRGRCIGQAISAGDRRRAERAGFKIRTQRVQHAGRLNEVALEGVDPEQPEFIVVEIRKVELTVRPPMALISISRPFNARQRRTVLNMAVPPTQSWTMSAPRPAVASRTRVAAPMDLGRRRITPALAGFVRVHPNLSIQLMLSDAGAESGEDLLDAAIRTGLPADQNVVARKLATARMLLWAAPSYVEAHGAPVVLADLQRHRCLLLARRHRQISHWHYREPGGTMVAIPARGTMSSTSGDVLRQWALAGEGLSLEAAWDMAEDLNEGRLVEYLPGTDRQELTLYATFLPGKPVPARIKLFVDWLSQLVAGPGALANPFR